MPAPKRKCQVKIPGMLTCEQAGQRLKMKADTIRRYVHRGLIRAGLVGNVYLISDAELERFQGTRRRPGNPNFSAKTA